MNFKDLTIILLISINSSCIKDSIVENEITNEFKLEFLNQILSDTIELKIISSKQQLISNRALLPPPLLPISSANSKKTVKHSKFISDKLNINDTTFVLKQFKSNKKMNLNELSNFGYRIYDMDLHLFKDEIPINVIHKQIDSLNERKNSYSFLSITKPIFNKKQNLAYIRIGQSMGGKTLILEKENRKWNIKETLDEWVE